MLSQRGHLESYPMFPPYKVIQWLGLLWFSLCNQFLLQFEFVSKFGFSVARFHGSTTKPYPIVCYSDNLLPLELMYPSSLLRLHTINLFHGGSPFNFVVSSSLLLLLLETNLSVGLVEISYQYVTRILATCLSLEFFSLYNLLNDL